METERHVKQMTLLCESLEAGWVARRDFYVGGDMFLYFSEVHSKRKDFRGPDVFVVLDVERKERRSWVVWEEGGTMPDVVIELLSDSTREIDRGEKMRVYAKVMRVAAYYLYDPFTHELEGYGLDPHVKEYRPMAVNEHGRLACPPLDLELGLWKGNYRGLGIPWLRWFDAGGSVLPTQAEQLALRVADEARRADEEVRIRRELEAKVAAYERRFGEHDDP